MTAVVGILNKSAIALAADSAVTVTSGNGTKIFNRANKIFTLSKYEPIGVMLYNSASLMATPWEIIIKVFREQLGTAAFPLLSDYFDEFLRFLRENSFFSTDEVQKIFLTDVISTIFNYINAEALRGELPISQIKDEKQENILRIIQSKIEAYGELISASPFERSPDFENFTFEEFQEVLYSESFEEAYKNIYEGFGYTLTPTHKDALRKIVFIHLASKEFLQSYTGLVFTGYGQKEIFPRLLSVKVSFALGARLRYYLDVENNVTITETMTTAIRPFAQQDVIMTILSGIDPTLNDLYLESFSNFLNDYNQKLAKLAEPVSHDLSSAILNLDVNKIVHSFAVNNLEIQKRLYLRPLLNAVATLSKEDLAEMAESLIYLTYLKRRMTNEEESVGGPVDVALISKGDGFIWIKRKHYFKPELNQPFFTNYLKTHFS